MVAINTTTEGRTIPALPESDDSNKTSNLAKRHRTELGLALLCAAVKPGTALTRPDIAAWMDCTHQAVDKIEKRALKKIAKKLLFADRAFIAEMGLGIVGDGKQRVRA